MTNADSVPADFSKTATVIVAIAFDTAARNPLVAPVIISDALGAISGEMGALGVPPAFLMEQGLRLYSQHYRDAFKKQAPTGHGSSNLELFFSCEDAAQQVLMSSVRVWST